MNRITASLTALGAVLALAGCTGGPDTQQASRVSAMVAGPGAGASSSFANPDQPGATGRAIVRGDNSTLDGDATATLMQRIGQL